MLLLKDAYAAKFKRSLCVKEYFRIYFQTSQRLQCIGVIFSSHVIALLIGVHCKKRSTSHTIQYDTIQHIAQFIE